ncbi:hypothetical protein ACIO3O_19590 [Streptomyces sp. NPDC087440]|uniref:hypothetical protein n=1 Tax=Streptomyces sp. NPDC087440 TaxID=3365790 RepID=UPI00381CAE33
MTLPVQTPPVAPVLVRTGVPGRPFAYVDPSPHVADEDGHVQTFSADEPDREPFCLLCGDEARAQTPGRRCTEAHLILIINDTRARWIADHRAEGGSS